MNTVSLSAGNTIVSAGPGNKWIDVYSKLDPLGLSVTGGRIADIGVAGLTTGGKNFWPINYEILSAESRYSK